MDFDQVNGAGEQAEAGFGEEETRYPPAQFHFVISTDKMTAYLRVGLSHKEQLVTREEILEAVKKQGVVYGVDEEEIDRFCEQKNFLRELRVASGKRPVKGEDGAVEFHFQKVMTGMPKERADGTVDFKSLDLIQNVQKGDLLCTVRQPKDGTDGTDVFGAAVKAKPGDMPPVPTGDKTVLTGDGRQLLADADGGLQFRNHVIFIEEVYTVRGNIGLETGNIDYNGSVVIHGNVQEGFSVKAKNDVTVNGVVEGAEVEAGGNILIRGGINGMGRAQVTAEGDISSEFIENARVRCGGNLFANAVLNSEIHVGVMMRLRGKRGALLGGSCRVGEVVNAKTIGNDKNIQQEVTIAPFWYTYEKMGLEQLPEDPEIRIEKLASKRERLMEQSSKISAEVARIQQPRDYDAAMSSGEKSQKMKEIILRKSKVSSEIAVIDKEIREIREFYKGHEFKIICTGDIFPGTRLSIGSAKLKVTSVMQNQKFYVDQGEITAGVVLPHERD